MNQREKNNKANSKKVIKALLWILLLSLSGFVLMMLISPDSRALPVFLIGFFDILAKRIQRYGKYY